jgi:hypothetical protein
MAKLTIQNFGGEFPKNNAFELADNAAQVAHNCILGNGDSRPLKSDRFIMTPARTGPKQTIFRLGNTGNELQYWMTWPTRVDVAPGPIANDTSSRFYWTGDGYPKVSNLEMAVQGGSIYPVNSYRLGVPRPLLAVTAAPSGEVSLTETVLPKPGKYVVSADAISGARTGMRFEAVISGGAPYEFSLTGTDINSIANAFATIPDITVAVVAGTIELTTTATGSNAYIQIRQVTGSQDTTTIQATEIALSAFGSIEEGSPRSARAFITQETAVAIPVGTTASVRVNGGPAMTSKFGAGALTNPPTVTLESAAAALGVFPGMKAVVGTNIKINDIEHIFPAPVLAIYTELTGTSASIEISKVTFAQSDIWETPVTREQTKGTDGYTITNNIPSEVRVYAYTYVSVFGEEGMPSDASTPTTVYEGQTVNLAGMSGPPPGPYNMVSKRIYRSAVGASGQAKLQFVAEVPVAQTSFTDNVPGTSLGEMNVTGNYAPPPETMQGLVSMQNGIMAAFNGNDILFCEPFLPYAWPEDYQLVSDYPIVGLSAFGQSLVVCTTGTPYLITGIDPSSMSMERIELNQACISKRSIVEVGFGVLYAGADGIVYVGNGGTRIFTELFYTQTEWQALNPSSIHAYLWDGKYVAFFERADGTKGSFLIHGVNGQPTLTFSDTWCDCAYVDPQTGGLYMIRDNDIVRFNDGDSLLTQRWRSKKFVAGDGFSASCAKVYADTYPVTFRAYVEGELLYQKQVTDRQPFRLPAKRGEWFEFEFEGTARVTKMMVANNMSEMRDV